MMALRKGKNRTPPEQGKPKPRQGNPRKIPVRQTRPARTLTPDNPESQSQGQNLRSQDSAANGGNGATHSRRRNPRKPRS
jgi:hypothetical protein